MLKADFAQKVKYIHHFKMQKNVRNTEEKKNKYWYIQPNK